MMNIYRLVASEEPSERCLKSRTEEESVGDPNSLAPFVAGILSAEITLLNGSAG